MKSESIFAAAAAFITLIGLGRNTDRHTLNAASGRLRQTIRVSNQWGSCAAVAVCSVIYSLGGNCVCLAANFECCCKLVVGER